MSLLMVVVRSAIIGAVLGVVVGLVCGVVYSVGGLIIDLITVGLNRGTLLAFGALIGMPAIFGAAGLVGGGAVGLIVRIFSGPADDGDGR